MRTRRPLPSGYRIETRQDVRTLWHDVLFHGEQYGSFPSRGEAVAYCHDDGEDSDDGSLGPCGCVDYHYADCPKRGVD